MRRTWRIVGLGVMISLSVAAAAETGRLAPGEYEFLIQHGDRSRSYLLHVPPQAAAGTPLPLVMALHGGGSNAVAMKQRYGLDRIADRVGYLVAYPNGSGVLQRTGLSWNAGQCCGYAMERRVDDVGFLALVIDDVARRIALDTKRVFVAGHSNGAMMAHRAAIELEPRIAAIAAVAGSKVVDEAQGTTPTSVLVIHSVDDPLALYHGGEGRRHLFSGMRSHHEPVEQTVTWWAKHNGCVSAPVVGPVREARQAGRTVTAQPIDYADCRNGATVRFWKLSGTGHGWTGQAPLLPERVMGPYAAAIDATEEIFGFFERVTR